MKTIDLLEMSIRSLWRRKVRTLLTILGVIIGACSIILMLSLGIAMDRNFEKQISEMGSLTVITVNCKQYEDPKAPKLDDKALDTLGKIPNVERVMPTLRTDAYLTYDKYRTDNSVSIYGCDAEDMEALGNKVDQGRDMEMGEKNVIIMNSQTPYQFVKIGKKRNWNLPSEPIEIDLETGKIAIEIMEFDYNTGKPNLTDSKDNKVKAPKPIQLRVVGILPETNYEDGIYVSKEVYNNLVEQKKKFQEKLYGKQTGSNNGNLGRFNDESQKGVYNEVKVKVSDRNKVAEVQEAIKAEGFSAYSSMDWLTEMKKVSNGMQMALGGIGAISLLVAAIGIANTMMMSIYERTREIGVMKVIGAKIVDIKKMFLVEALMIGALGGIVGVIISYIISLVINKVGGGIAGMIGMYGADKVSVIPPWLALGAIVFSTIIGLVSGYFPARRAMKLSALSAIKTE